DLITKGTTEPYRMFTSRAEYRLMLRLDNVEERLSPLGRRLGLLTEDRFARFEREQFGIRSAMDLLKERRVNVGGQGLTLEQALRRPEVSLADVERLGGVALEGLSELQRFGIESRVKYQGYIERQVQEADKMKKWEGKRIPGDLDFRQIPGLTREAAEKLDRIRPETFGQASRISGLTPAALSLLRIYIEKRRGRSDGGTAAVE
ncbi:MAG TPA: tRNA uridine-5-carboxymethylaminomethyl(34) synthesis enzyme MnmG, partial [Acidobacteriota bacterium]|nr:tRNA uridine-5-carboxymethylaminomethyl(34) synthesis enzyme MnmG [Acidobacteriota bacterium]